MSGGKHRILVVDDEPGMREGCRRTLAAEGYEVETAADGLAGLELFRAKRDFSAALIDLKMPRMGGIELIEEIRKLDQDIVLIVITAYATIDTAVEATKRGGYGYIPKPFTPDELLLPVRNGLERRTLAIEARRLREEREKGLLALAYERSKSSTIINCMTDGVLVVDRGRQVVLRNAAAACVLPECASLALPAPLARFGSPDIETLVAGALDARSRPVIVSREMVLARRTYMVNASPVAEPEGDPLGVVVVVRDITELKKLEVAKSMFVSMVAHEVKSPLAAIEGYLNVILSGIAGSDPERDRKMIERSLVRARALRGMVIELMNITAIQTGNFSLKRAPLDLKGVLAEAVEAAREKAEAKGTELALACEVEDGRGSVVADRDAMLTVFNNLIDNAVKYTPDKGHVRVGLRRDGQRVKVSVRDDGIGMRPEEKERVFEEFFRAKNEFTSRVPGTGLGLALVKRLVDMHQGNIDLETAPGKGSTFTVSLPAADST